MNCIALVGALCAALPGPAALTVADATGRAVEAAAVLRDVRRQIPEAEWDRAHCVIVAPGFKPAEVQGGGGGAVMSCRNGAGWTAPLFMHLARGSWKNPGSSEPIDLILLVMTESGVEKLIAGAINPGTDASISAGPVSGAAPLGASATAPAELLSYVRSDSGFTGADLAGVLLRADDAANREVYGDGATPRRILATRALSAPPQAASFLSALGSGQPAAPVPPDTAARETGSTEPGPRNLPQAAADDDVRAHLVDAAQLIDRLLADTMPESVGTAGTAGISDQRPSGAVTVDRVRLIQVRQQIEAAIRALNKQR